jgi:hypothetical protein
MRRSYRNPPLPTSADSPHTAGLFLAAETGGGLSGGAQRGGPVWHAQERALELPQRLFGLPPLQQHLAVKLQSRLQEVRRTGRGRHRRLGLGSLGEQRQPLLLLTARETGQPLDLLFEDCGHAAAVDPGR